MQKYKILLLGHSSFPSGIKDFLDFFGVPIESIITLSMKNDIDFDDFKAKLRKIIQENEYLIIITDLVGGSPYKMAVEITTLEKKENQYLISGISLGSILDIAVKSSIAGTNNLIEDIKKIVNSNKIIIYNKDNKILLNKNKLKKQIKQMDGI